MTHYDFHALLEPYEYQYLICDILQIREKVTLEVYKEGRDQGIDGSFISSDGRTVVQAKRYGTNFASLWRTLKAEELPKVKLLKPDRYILAVSMDFTPAQKQKIAELFEGFILSTSDIITQSDINLLFEKPEYHSVQMAYPKLWYASFQVMQKAFDSVVHAGYHIESRYELSEAIQQAALYVPTRQYRRSIENWNRSKVLLITGVPGIGKTSMARVLALSYLHGHDTGGYVWVHSIQEVYEHWDDAERVVFILDDFWGSIFREEHTNQEETRLVKLIQRIAGGKEDKRLILTTREYILQQGYKRHPELESVINQYACVCSLEGYNESERASILYKHLYASGLSYDYVEYLYLHSEEIVFHKSYDPRILALFLSNIKPESSPHDYLCELLEHFDSPTAFWEGVFTKLSADAQTVAVLLMISSPPTTYDCMSLCYDKYVAFSDRSYFPKKLSECISELEKTLIITHYDEDLEQVTMHFRVPAVQDFLYARLQDNAVKYVQQLLGYCCFFNQYAFLYRHLSRYCSDNTVDYLAEALIANYDSASNSMYDYYEIDDYGAMDKDYLSSINLSRFHNLLTLYDRHKTPLLKAFLESAASGFFPAVTTGSTEEMYYDLWNLPSILSRMKGLGLSVPTNDVVSTFCKHAFSLHHVSALQYFEQVYPEDYKSICLPFFDAYSKAANERLLAEVGFLQDMFMDYELDTLVDSAEIIYNEFGWDFSDEFETELYLLAEREPPGSDHDVPAHNRLETMYDRIQNSFLQTQQEHSWILGPEENQPETDSIINLIKKPDISEALKADILSGVNENNSYINRYMNSGEDLMFYTQMMSRHGCEVLPERESDFLLFTVLGCCGEDESLFVKLLHLLSLCYPVFMYKLRPVTRKATLYEEPDLKEFFEDVKLRSVFEENFTVQDGQWVRFIHIPIFILAYVMHTAHTFRFESDILAYDSIFPENDPFFRVVENSGLEKTLHEYRSEYSRYPFSNVSWRACMYRLYEELDTWSFNREFVYPAMKELVADLTEDGAENEVLSYISYIELQLLYDQESALWHLVYSTDDYTDLAESLSIIDVDYGVSISDSAAEKLKESKIEGGIHWDSSTGYLLEKLRDTELLSQLIDIKKIKADLAALHAVYQKFCEGDFSSIFTA